MATKNINTQYNAGDRFRLTYADQVDLVNADDQVRETYPVVICETDEEFEEWAAGEKFAAFFDGEVYVKVRGADGDYEAMTMTAANELLGDLVYA